MIVLLSGEIAAGKTAVASELTENFEYQPVKSGAHLKEIAKARNRGTDRESLQELGDVLDKETEGAWIAELAHRQISETGAPKKLVLDSVRRDFQVDRFRKLFGSDVTHVHLKADPALLHERFRQRSEGDSRDDQAVYSEVKSNETEKHASGLGDIADLAVNSGKFSPNQLAMLIDLAVTSRP